MTALGLTIGQHDAVGRLIAAAGITVRKEAGPLPRGPVLPDVARIMIVDDTYPVYSPLVPRKVALFAPSPDTQQTTVQMFGCDLDGYILLTIDGTEFRVDCQSSIDQLSGTLGLGRTCRVTAFPGTWEFAWKKDAPEVTARPSDGFYGGLIVRQELFLSVTDDGRYPILVDCLDAIPFIEGEVKRGALSIAWQHGVDTFLAAYWRDPAFNFAART